MHGGDGGALSIRGATAGWKMGINREWRWSCASQRIPAIWNELPGKVAGAVSVSLRHLDYFLQERIEEWSEKPGKRDLKHITTLI